MLLALLLADLILPAPAAAKTDAERAYRLLEQGHIPEARRALEAELRKHPNHIEARYNLAVLLEEMLHQSEAEALYRRNLKQSWHLPSLINLVVMLKRQKRVDEAIDWLRSATKHLRHEAAPWYMLAEISESRGDLQHAGEQYRQATRADPLNGFGWLRLAQFQSRHRLDDRGLKYGKKAIRLLADCAACWRRYGDILTANERHHEALAAYQRSLAIDPDAKTRQQLINTLRRLGETERAERMQQTLDAWLKHRMP